MPRNYTPKSTPEAINHRKQSRFLRELLENGGFVWRAIRDCHLSRRWLNDQIDTDENFAELYATIRDQNNERIEQEIYRRAVLGVDKELTHLGRKTGETVKEYSDLLLKFYAEGNMPDKYRPDFRKGPQISDDELNARIKSLMDKRKAPAPALDEGEPFTESVN